MMKLLAVKPVNIKKRQQSNLAIPEAKLLVSKMINSLLILALSLLINITLLFPRFLDVFSVATLSANISGWVTALAGMLLMGFLSVVPFIRSVQSTVDYRRALELDRLGRMTRGKIIDKWIDTLNTKHVYRVRYEYLSYLNAMQTVDEATFQQLRRGEIVIVLYLENLPHISRLDLD